MELNGLHNDATKVSNRETPGAPYHDRYAPRSRSEPGERPLFCVGMSSRKETHVEDNQVKALLPDGLIDELLAGARTQEEIAGTGGLLGQLTQRLVKQVGPTDHLGSGAHRRTPSHRSRDTLEAPSSPFSAWAYRSPVCRK